VNRDATRLEMRSFVCGQCHVEYYFQGKEKRLVYPWSKGLRADQILAYYNETGFRDWVHAQTGAETLKAQHPEFEMWNQGVHARSGVACADCHMPFLRAGAAKISDHHVRSPLLNVQRACQTCHPIAEAELQERVRVIQDRTFELRDRALNAVTQLIADLAAAKTGGREDEGVVQARRLQREAQFLADFVEAENSMGFHAPQEAARVLALAVDLARQGQISLRDPAFRAQALPQSP
jgi:nitrite reductase (cytochrome c-552)